MTISSVSSSEAAAIVVAEAFAVPTSRVLPSALIFAPPSALFKVIRLLAIVQLIAWVNSVHARELDDSRPAATSSSSSVTETPPNPAWQLQMQENEAQRRRSEEMRHEAIAALLSETVYLGGSGFIAILIKFAGDNCDSGCDELDLEEGEPRYEWRNGTEKVFSSWVFPVVGTLCTIGASGIITAINNHDSHYHTRFTATLVGSVIGFALDIGLMCILYFQTETASALIWPTAAGFLIFPTLGGVVGNHLSRRDDKLNPLPQEVTPSAFRQKLVVLPVVSAAVVTQRRTVPVISLVGSF